MKNAQNNAQEKSCWERIETVIKRSSMTANAFARHIGLPRGENLYQIKRGNNRVSFDVADRICAKFPCIDKLWLLTGEGQLLKDEKVSISWSTIDEAFQKLADELTFPKLAGYDGRENPYAIAQAHANRLYDTLTKKGGQQ